MAGKESKALQASRQNILLYPVYIDSQKKISDGRKLPLAKCVAGPNPQEIIAACQTLKLDATLEATKAHPRNFQAKGRICIKFRKADRSFLHPTLQSRPAAFAAIAAEIAKKPNRTVPKVTPASAQSSFLPASSGGKAGKKGKKKGKR